MNVIEAIQAAEGGALITNTFLKSIGRFLRYKGNGIFYEYELVQVDPKDESSEYKAEYKHEVRVFSISYILNKNWEKVENKYFDK